MNFNDAAFKVVASFKFFPTTHRWPASISWIQCYLASGLSISVSTLTGFCIHNITHSVTSALRSKFIVRYGSSGILAHTSLFWFILFKYLFISLSASVTSFFDIFDCVLFIAYGTIKLYHCYNPVITHKQLIYHSVECCNCQLIILQNLNYWRKIVNFMTWSRPLSVTGHSVMLGLRNYFVRSVEYIVVDVTWCCAVRWC